VRKLFLNVINNTHLLPLKYSAIDVNRINPAAVAAVQTLDSGD